MILDWEQLTLWWEEQKASAAALLQLLADRS